MADADRIAEPVARVRSASHRKHPLKLVHLVGQDGRSRTNRDTGPSRVARFSATLLHGLAPALDLGAKLTFNYGEEGIVTQIVPGIKVQAVARVTFFDNEKLNLGMRFEPGPLVYFTSFETTAGLALPVGLQLGISLSSAFLLSVGVDAPVFRTFGAAGGWVFPILFGGGLEYFVAPDLAATFKVEIGPAVDTRGFRPISNLALEGLFGIAYRL